MNRQRIERELTLLREGNQTADLVVATDERECVLYREVPTNGRNLGLPLLTDVIVPVPSGYPASPIDLAGLPVNSPFLDRVKGGTNCQGIISANDRDWQIASYHPHNGGGGPPWDQIKFGFHTYIDHLIAWLNHI